MPPLGKEWDTCGGPNGVSTFHGPSDGTEECLLCDEWGLDMVRMMVMVMMAGGRVTWTVGQRAG